jgi:hypothetical protein
MLDALWSAPGLRCISAIRGKETLHFWHEDTSSAMEQAVELDARGYNVYFAPAVFDPTKVNVRKEEINPRTGRKYTGREQPCVHVVAALWLDLDVGEGKDYPTLPEALSALQEWSGKAGVPTPSFLVQSGYGLHVYWKLKSPVPRDRWEPVAQHLKQVCRLHGLSADPSRTSDCASLLRVPGTHNHKRGQRAPVRVLGESGESYDLQSFRAALPVVGPQGAVPNRTMGEWNTQAKLPPGDAKKIGDKCAQMGHVRFARGAVEEPLWRAALSILWRCEGGEELIHTWSDGDERYNPVDTLDKAKGTQGPATCQHFNELRPEGCMGCPHAGQVNSPIMLAFAEELPETQDGEVVTGTPGYTVTAEGIFMEPAAEGGPLTRIADFPVWIEEARELVSVVDGTLDARLLMGWKDARGEYRQAPLTQVELHDSRQFTAWLASNNLASFVQGIQMAQYISRMHKARFKEKGARVVYEALGWYRDHDLFVLGRKGVSPAGLVDVVVDTSGPIADIEPAGTLEGWKQAVSILGRPEYRAQAFGLLVGFASPLLDLVGVDGAVVVFTGRSGVGKTLAAEAGLSVLLNPQKGYISGTSSHGGIAKRLAQHRHAPVLVDEITGMKPYKLRDLIYMAANGADKTTLTQTRNVRNAETWRTVTMLTSNHSIVDMAQAEIEEAHRRRLIEVPVLAGLTKEEAKVAYKGLEENHGVAALPYLQLIMKHKASIPALFELVEKEVEGWGFEEAADRFGVWTCSAALLGGILAYAAGVLPFNPVPVIKYVVQQSIGHSDRIMEPAEHAQQSLLEFLTTHSKQIVHWHRMHKLASIDAEDPVARIDPRSRIIYVRASSINEHWAEQRLFMRALGDWFHKVGVKGFYSGDASGRRARSVRLSPGTPPVNCYAFDMDKLGWDPQEEEEEEEEEEAGE